MNIENIFITTTSSQKTSKSTKTQTKASTKEETVSYETLNTGSMNAADKLYKRIGSLKTNYTSLDRMNARNVVSLASNVICKGNDIHTSLSDIVYRFQAQISRILCSGSTKEEIENQIKAIEDKINAAAKEANVKMDILISLSDSLFKLGNIAQDMKNNDMDSYNGVDFIKQLIEKMNTKVDDFSKTDTDEDTVKEKITKDLDNVYGKESQRKLEKKKEEFENRINEIKERLQNPNLAIEETNKLKALLELYTHRVDAISNILDIINQFSSQNTNEEIDLRF